MMQTVRRKKLLWSGKQQPKPLSSARIKVNAFDTLAQGRTVFHALQIIPWEAPTTTTNGSSACVSFNVAYITPYNGDMSTTIRPATCDDVPQILDFIRALAAYEREPEAVTAIEADLMRHGFGLNPFFFCLIAEQNGTPAGFALYFFNYSTWLGRPGLYLEDLFVLPEFRGLGIGKALLQKVAAIAIENGCQRLQWEVLDWNTPAIDFYQAMGAEFLDAWRNVRVSGDALRRLAGVVAENPEMAQ